MEISTVYLLCRHIIRASPTKEAFIKPFQVTDSCFIFTKEVHEWFLRMSIPSCTRCSSHMVPLSPRRLGTCGGSPPPRGLVCKLLHSTCSSPSSLCSQYALFFVSPSRSSVPIGTSPPPGVHGAPAPQSASLDEQPGASVEPTCLPWLCFCPGPFFHPSQETTLTLTMLTALTVHGTLLAGTLPLACLFPAQPTATEWRCRRSQCVVAAITRHSFVTSI